MDGDCFVLDDNIKDVKDDDDDGCIHDHCSLLLFVLIKSILLQLSAVSLLLL